MSLVYEALERNSGPEVLLIQCGLSAPKGIIKTWKPFDAEHSKVSFALENVVEVDFSSALQNLLVTHLQRENLHFYNDLIYLEHSVHGVL